MRKLIVHFAGETKPELFETLFSHPLVGDERRCIRGKRSGAFRGYSTFQWTKAVQALSLVILEAALRKHAPAHEPLLIGGSGSFASSLDYAIDKQTSWLFEMFGWDSKGAGLSRRLLVRTNPGQRMPGPVAISLNNNYLQPSEITVLLDYAEVNTEAGLRGLKERIVEQAVLAGEAGSVPTLQVVGF